jgi:23S rRNA pseudouridine1911/1915/1917 synthase
VSGPGGTPEWREHSVRPYEDGWTVEAVLTDSLLLPRREVLRLTRDRALRLNRRSATLRDVVRHADTLRLRTGASPTASGLEPAEIDLRVVHEDDAVLLLDKPPFLRVHPSEPGQRHTLVNGVAAYYARRGAATRIHLVHRLDRDTSGLILLAKTSDAHRRLAEQLERRGLRRTYIAVASGEIAEERGIIDAPIGINPTQRVLRAVRADGEPARTGFRVLRRLSSATLVELELETGRTHQIRVHLAHLGHPLVGDRQYGRRGNRLIGRQALHAARLRFGHPTTDAPSDYEAPLPDDMRSLIETLDRRP